MMDPGRQVKVPFQKAKELQELSATAQWLPGQPRVPLGSNDVLPYLVKELSTPRLNRLAPHLWLVAKPDSSHISSLTRQGTRGRSVVVTEDPELHLVWKDSKVFLKPLPEWLLSYDIWAVYLCAKELDDERQELVKAALGFLRSYALLITHQSDFHIAQSKDSAALRLIPESITYEDFCSFIAAFADIPDSDVPRRWHFGELRLKRLNFWSKIFVREHAFMKVNTGYDDTISRYFTPLAFVFAFFSVALSAMQVSLGVLATSTRFDAGRLIETSWRFSIASLCIIVFSLFIVVCNIAFFMLRELIYAVGQQIKLRRAGAENRSVED